MPYFASMKGMKRGVLLLVFSSFLCMSEPASAQCSICTKTAQQMGHKPAKALNAGIIYLMMAPLAIMGFVGFRWWKNNGRG
jgi:hypothetical protein